MHRLDLAVNNKTLSDGAKRRAPLLNGANMNRKKVKKRPKEEEFACPNVSSKQFAEDRLRSLKSDEMMPKFFVELFLCN